MYIYIYIYIDSLQFAEDPTSFGFHCAFRYRSTNVSEMQIKDENVRANLPDVVLMKGLVQSQVFVAEVSS